MKMQNKEVETVKNRVIEKLTRKLKLLENIQDDFENKQIEIDELKKLLKSK